MFVLIYVLMFTLMNNYIRSLHAETNIGIDRIKMRSKTQILLTFPFLFRRIGAYEVRNFITESQV